MISWKEDLRQFVFACVIQPTLDIRSFLIFQNLIYQRYLSLHRPSCQEYQCDPHPPSHPGEEAGRQIFSETKHVFWYLCAHKGRCPGKKSGKNMFYTWSAYFIYIYSHEDSFESSPSKKKRINQNMCGTQPNYNFFHMSIEQTNVPKCPCLDRITNSPCVEEFFRKVWGCRFTCFAFFVLCLVLDNDFHILSLKSTVNVRITNCFYHLQWRKLVRNFSTTISNLLD